VPSIIVNSGIVRCWMSTNHNFRFGSICFSECDSRPRDLHSFPTRRSSDLHGLRPRCIGRRGFPVPALPVGGSPWQLFVKNFTKRDRKSTRLNSSHSQNSYAVFCLKKKTTTQTHKSNYLQTY